MLIDQYDTNFAGLSPPEFIFTMTNFADSLLHHEILKNDWPNFLTHPATLKEMVAAYSESVTAMEKDGGRKNQTTRDDWRNKATVSATLMSQYVVMRSVHLNNPDLLKTVALKLRQRTPKSSSKEVLLSQVIPDPVTLTHAGSEGIYISYKKPPHCGSCEIQVCYGDTPDENSMTTIGLYNKARIELRGQKPGTRIWVRVRFHGDGEPSPYSIPVSIIII